MKKIFRKLNHVFKTSLNILTGRVCLLCDSYDLSNETDIICNKCLEFFNKPEIENCGICHQPMENNTECPSCKLLEMIWYDRYDFIQYYTGYIKKLMYLLKKEENFIIIKLFYHLIRKNINIPKETPITFVPDSFIRGFKKGRSGLKNLAGYFKKDGFNVKTGILKRKQIYFKPQKKLSVKKRLSAIKERFFINDKEIDKYNGSIILIDDIYTSGATLNYNAFLLKKAGFENVRIISFFRAVKGAESINY